MKLAAVIVLYNPNQEVVQNLSTYVDDVDKVYIIDNSIQDNSSVFEPFYNTNKLEYIANKANLGLANALNQGCLQAINDGFNYVLTMDQDSYFEKGSLQKQKRCIYKNENLSIVSPNVKSLYKSDYGVEEVAFIQYDTKIDTLKNWTMTSGSIINLLDYQKVGGFDNSLFIAHIDIDYGIRIHNLGKKIIVISDSYIYQHFGNSKPKKILWRTVHPSFASPDRTYYIFRNQFYLKNKYGKMYDKFAGVSLWKFVVKILIFEDEKFEKIKMMVRGIWDAKRKNMGSINKTKKWRT